MKGVNSLRNDLRVARRGVATPYHTEVGFWWELCIRQGVEGLKRSGDESAALRKAVANIDLALSMPTAENSAARRHR